MIHYIHKKMWKNMFTDQHITSVTNVHTRKNDAGGGKRGRFFQPSTESIELKKKKNPELWLRSFQVVFEGGACTVQPPSSRLSAKKSLLFLAHCLDRKPGRLGPDSERMLFLLLCDCFLLTPLATLHAPGGPVFIRVPECSRAVPEGCAVSPKRGGERVDPVGVVSGGGFCVCLCEKRGRWRRGSVQSEVKKGLKKKKNQERGHQKKK